MGNERQERKNIHLQSVIKIMIPKDGTGGPALVQDGDHLFPFGKGGHDGGSQYVPGEQDDGILVLVLRPERGQPRFEPGSTTRWFLFVSSARGNRAKNSVLNDFQQIGMRIKEGK